VKNCCVTGISPSSITKCCGRRFEYEVDHTTISIHALRLSPHIPLYLYSLYGAMPLNEIGTKGSGRRSTNVIRWSLIPTCFVCLEECCTTAPSCSYAHLAMLPSRSSLLKPYPTIHLNGHSTLSFYGCRIINIVECDVHLEFVFASVAQGQGKRKWREGV
jgi:hypothetical protein